MTMISPDDGRPSVSRTARYKKVTKPLLERKRRARINRCLDELKDLMVGAFEVEGDNISKLEKADILELTVRHLTKLHSPRDPIADAKRFQAGFGQCAAEACQFILSMPDVDTQIGQNLVQHLSSQINEGPLSVQVPVGRNFSPPVSPEAPTVWSSPLNNEDPRGLNNIKEQVNRSIPANYHNQIREENLSHVPVNQSLVCDIATLRSSPTIQEISQPLAGLLMTVDTQQGINHNVRHPELIMNKNDADSIIRIGRESDMIQNTKAKNIIIKKIREQILERQVKESEPKASFLNLTRELPAHTNNEDQHQPALHNTVPPKRAYKRKHEKIDVQNNITETFDLRKKSKGEAKHFSPAMIDVVNSNYESFQNAAYSMGRFSNPIQGNPNPIQEDLNNTKYHPRDPRKYNYSEDQVTVTKIDKSDAETNRSHPDEHYITQKRHADYRNIHPKKAIIRPLKYTEEREINLVQETSRQYRIPVENFEQTSRSSLRDQRFSNIPSHPHPDSSSRYHQAAREFRTEERQYRRVSLDYEHMGKYSNSRSGQEQYPRYHQVDGIDQEYMRPYDPNQEQEDDENMWRPW